MKYINADKLLAEIEQLNSLVPYENNDRHDDGLHDAYKAIKNIIASLEQETEEQQEISLEKFSEKMDAWKSRYNYPDSIPIKAAMAFTARMFYMYPNVAREWYDSLPKVTLD